MLWKRKEKTTIGQFGNRKIPPIPPKKEFATMLQMVIDAEGYDTENENQFRDIVLTRLCQCITSFKLKNSVNRAPIDTVNELSNVNPKDIKDQFDKNGLNHERIFVKPEDAFDTSKLEK